MLRGREIKATRVALAAFLLSIAGCGGTTGVAAMIVDPGASSVDSDAGNLSDAAASPCGPGSWSLLESVTACGDCPSLPDPLSVGLSLSEQVAVEGGTIVDTQGNTWQFSSTTCSATMSGTCNASSTDKLDFASGEALCMVTCPDNCVACQTPCELRRESP